MPLHPYDSTPWPQPIHLPFTTHMISFTVDPARIVSCISISWIWGYCWNAWTPVDTISPLWPHVMTPTCPFTYQPKPTHMVSFPAAQWAAFQHGDKTSWHHSPCDPTPWPHPSTSLYKATHMVSFQMDLAANIVFCISTWKMPLHPSTPVYTLSPLWPHPPWPQPVHLPLSGAQRHSHFMFMIWD